MLPTKRTGTCLLIDSILKESKVSKTAAFDKFADFPSIFLQLKPEMRKMISTSYSVGPKSEQQEISIDKVTKKPYNEQLLVYTTSVLSEKEQRDAAQMLNDKRRDLEKKLRDDPQYQKLEGSQAGTEYKKEKVEGGLEKFKADVDKKFTPKERPVAWGEGTNFQTNQDLFSWHYGRTRRGGYSDAPGNRKDLIEYIKANGGKVYAISQDLDVRTKRQERGKNAPPYTSPEIQVIKDRAKKLGAEKKLELDAIVDQYFESQKASLLASVNKSFSEATENIKAGKAQGVPTINLALDQSLLERIANVYYKIISDSDPLSSTYSRNLEEVKQKLIDYSKGLNNLIDTIKKNIV